MARPRPPFEGSCLRGAVRVGATVAPLLTFACHCRDCRKLSASASALTAVFPGDSSSCIGDLTEGGLFSSGRRHVFCRSCLNFICSPIAGADQRINLRTSILNDAAPFGPFVALRTGEKLPWAHGPAGHSFSQYPAGPDDLQALMNRCADQ
ncbi:aldehyde-activating protein (plasmid) [Paroceanicella profunda]|uniref:Aldehyde-activating protein n=1 Tax=Paroceanicella profunda TaxID=2579971 RepID=A0A5B8G1D1_9RHOB|nr:GFA family protein [Paroceanicella profunda]QDL93834.1 aldehyde-activating protein [Paroceanicella profunda]